MEWGSVHDLGRLKKPKIDPLAMVRRERKREEEERVVMHYSFFLQYGTHPIDSRESVHNSL